jgi:hypothetical protein
MLTNVLSSMTFVDVPIQDIARSLGTIEESFAGYLGMLRDIAPEVLDVKVMTRAGSHL